MKSSRAFHRPTRGRRRRRAAAAAVLTLALLAIPAAAFAASLTVKATFPKSNPVVNKPWPIELNVSDGKDKIHGNVQYKFYYLGSQVGGTQEGHRFSGHIYKDKLKFPKQSVGIPLTLHVVVATNHGTRTVAHKVTTRQ